MMCGQGQAVFPHYQWLIVGEAEKVNSYQYQPCIWQLLPVGKWGNLLRENTSIVARRILRAIQAILDGPPTLSHYSWWSSYLPSHTVGHPAHPTSDTVTFIRGFTNITRIYKIFISFSNVFIELLVFNMSYV